MALRSLIFITLAINFALAFIVWSHNRKRSQNKRYVLFVVFLNLWILSNFLENEPGWVGLENLEFFLRLDFVFGVLSMYSLYYLAKAFLKQKYAKAKQRLRDLPVQLVVGTMMGLSMFSDLVIHNVVFDGNVISFSDGALWPLYAIVTFGSAFAGIITLMIARRQKKKGSIDRRQIDFILMGFLISVGNAIIINLFLQPFFPISLEVSRLGLYGMSFLIVLTGYAILKHNLFNIRVVATEILVISLIISLMTRLFKFEQAVLQPTIYAFDVIIFISFSVFGFYLVQSIRKEIKQREEIEELAQSLENANIRLKELDKQKTEFLSIASHQLRTPLSIIKGYLELMSDGAFGRTTKKMQETIRKMDESNERLVVLVDEFLNITRIEQGRTKYAFEDDNIVDVINSAIEELEPKAEAAGLNIVWKGKKAVNLCMDKDKVRHVIFNYIDNAIKYTPKGKITVSLKEEGKGYKVTVKDTGFGFTKEEGAGLFQKFYRAESVKTTNVNGNGLGIYVCRKFIEAHDGKVWADSAGLKKGSTFGFWIPVKGPKKKNRTV